MAPGDEAVTLGSPGGRPVRPRRAGGHGPSTSVRRCGRLAPSGALAPDRRPHDPRRRRAVVVAPPRSTPRPTATGRRRRRRRVCLAARTRASSSPRCSSPSRSAPGTSPRCPTSSSSSSSRGRSGAGRWRARVAGLVGGWVLDLVPPGAEAARLPRARLRRRRAARRAVPRARDRSPPPRVAAVALARRVVVEGVDVVRALAVRPRSTSPTSACAASLTATAAALVVPLVVGAERGRRAAAVRVRRGSRRAPRADARPRRRRRRRVRRARRAARAGAARRGRRVRRPSAARASTPARSSSRRCAGASSTAPAGSLADNRDEHRRHPRAAGHRRRPVRGRGRGPRGRPGARSRRPPTCWAAPGCAARTAPPRPRPAGPARRRCRSRWPTDVDPARALALVEQPDRFPGVAVTVPGAGLPAARRALAPPRCSATSGRAAAEDLAADPTLVADDLVGRAGLEQEYDRELRGTPGRTVVAVDARGLVTGVVVAHRPRAGPRPRHLPRRRRPGVRRAGPRERDAAGPHARLARRLRRASSSSTPAPARVGGPGEPADLRPERVDRRHLERRLRRADRCRRRHAAALAGHGRRLRPGEHDEAGVGRRGGARRALPRRHLRLPRGLPHRGPRLPQLRVDAAGPHQPAPGPSRSPATPSSTSSRYRSWQRQGGLAARATTPDPFATTARGLGPRRADRHRPARRVGRPRPGPRVAPRGVGGRNAAELCRRASTGYPEVADRRAPRLPHRRRAGELRIAAGSCGPATPRTSRSGRATCSPPPCRWPWSTAPSPTAGTVRTPRVGAALVDPATGARGRCRRRADPSGADRRRHRRLPARRAAPAW